MDLDKVAFANAGLKGLALSIMEDKIALGVKGDH